MDSFDLKQFLVKNKLTENSKLNDVKIYPGNTGQFHSLNPFTLLTKKTLFADFIYRVGGNNSDDINSRFARSISELLNLLKRTNTLQGTHTIDDIFEYEEMNDVEDGDESYASSAESLAFFQKLPLHFKFIVTHNINGYNESFEITKIGSNSFTTEEIDNELDEITINPQSTGIKLGGDSPFFSFVKNNKQEIASLNPVFTDIIMNSGEEKLDRKSIYLEDIAYPDYTYEDFIKDWKLYNPEVIVLGDELMSVFVVNMSLPLKFANVLTSNDYTFFGTRPNSENALKPYTVANKKIYITWGIPDPGSN
jgi:hypothetical protein